MVSVLLDVLTGVVVGYVAVETYRRTRRRLRKQESVLVYRCPAHGLIESPTWHEDEIRDDSWWYCPINLTGKASALHDGITDDVCGKDVCGPFTAEVDER